MAVKKIGEMTPGDSAQLTRTVSESDVTLFAGITGDKNPVHMDPRYAEKTPFKTRIAHGMLSAGFISAVIGTRLPGPGTIYLRQELNFLRPVIIGDTITATVVVEEILSSKKQIRLETVCVNQRGEKVLEGQALVSPPR